MEKVKKTNHSTHKAENKISIRRFYIEKLFNERDVNIDFTDTKKILVAGNGSGKTTILNMFYALLSGNITKLRRVGFKKIGIVFSNDDDISFEKEELELDFQSIRDHPFFEHLISKISHDELAEIFEMNTASWSTNSSLLSRISDKVGIPINALRSITRDFTTVKNRKGNSSLTTVQKKFEKIKTLFPCQLLYLPTYRRVEEDIRAFSSTSTDGINRDLSINFGMSDVRDSIKSITTEILTSSVEWFSKINGQMLSQLVDGFVVTDEMTKSVSSKRSVEIVLERIGKNISSADKEKILALVSSGEIKENHEPLVYFVANLLSVYEQQKENDEAIQRFTKVCNTYLNDKEIIYNEGNVEIKVVRKKNGSTVNLESLSSGEKQIISLFALLYLEKRKDLAIFFDEPELSLSVEWQRTLLPDIISSEKCRFLFCVTHSPFIFENSLASVTVDLAEYVKEY